MWSNLGVGFQDWKILLRASVSGGSLFGGLTGNHRLEKDHLGLLDHRLDHRLNHLHRGTKPPGFQSRGIVSRLLQEDVVHDDHGRKVRVGASHNSQLRAWGLPSLLYNRAG